MKVSKILLFTLAIGLIIFSSCKKEELEDTNYPNPDPPVNDLGKLSCFVSTGYWKADSYSVSYLNDVVKIQAVNEKKDTMIFNVIIENGVHYYNFNSGNNNFAVYKENGTTGSYSTSFANSSSGNVGHIKIYIDTTNSIISGSFAYKAYEYNNPDIFYTITEGEFSNIKYAKQEVITTNTMSGIIFNDTINSLSPVYASKNYSNFFEIRGYHNTSKYIGVYFDAPNLSAGDSIPFNSNQYGYYYDGTQLDSTSNGYVKILQFNDSTKIIKGKFESYFDSGSIKNGNFNVEYIEQ